MRAAILHGKHDLRVEEIDRPDITPEQVLVRISKVGICGSDMHFYEDLALGPFVIKGPFILGHESAGVVAEVGSSVSDLVVGDRVAIEPGVPCRECRHCKTGRYNLCTKVEFLSAPPVDGCFREYVPVAADFAHKIDSGMSLVEGAMIEPLSVGLQAVNRAQVQPGDSVCILGAGTIGLMTLLAAKARGAGFTVSVDVLGHRLDLATSMGANAVVNANDENTTQKVLEITDGGADVVFECAGTVPTTKQTIDVAARGGRVTLVGWPGSPQLEFKTEDILERELDVLGVNRYCNCYPPAIGLVRDGLANVGSLITHTFPLAGIAEAIEFAIAKKDNSIKIVIDTD